MKYFVLMAELLLPKSPKSAKIHQNGSDQVILLGKMFLFEQKLLLGQELLL